MSTNLIHPTAIIEKSVELGADVSVGPFSILKGRLRVGRGTKIEGHVCLGSDSTVVEIGEDNLIQNGAVLGGPPQDLSYKNEPTKLVIGSRNTIREFVTVNCGTMKGGGVTTIGNDCMLMAYVHVAHDCNIGHNVIIANLVQFAGHVQVENNVRIGGMVGLVQFTRLGKYCYIGGASTVRKDVPPFTIAEGGSLARVRATNKIGLQRSGFSKEDVDNIARAVRFLVAGDRTIDEALQKISAECTPSEHIDHFVNFIKSSEAGVAR
jgi:UDP-N-acetylglucosamine acyltransferase